MGSIFRSLATYSPLILQDHQVASPHETIDEWRACVKRARSPEIDRAVAEERERCARIGDKYLDARYVAALREVKEDSRAT